MAPDGTVTATVWLEPAGNPVYSLDLLLAYDPTATLVAVEAGPLAHDLALSYNTRQSGEVRVALAGARPVTRPGALLRLRLRSTETFGSAVRPLWGQVNEGAIPLRMEAARHALRVYLPLVAR